MELGDSLITSTSDRQPNKNEHIVMSINVTQTKEFKKGKYQTQGLGH